MLLNKHHTILNFINYKPKSIILNRHDNRKSNNFSISAPPSEKMPDFFLYFFLFCHFLNAFETWNQHSPY